MSQPPAGKGRWRKQTLVKRSGQQGTENWGKGGYKRHFETWRFCKAFYLTLHHRNYRKRISFHYFSRQKRVSCGECKEYVRGLRSVDAKQLRKAEIIATLRKKNTCLYLIYFSIHWTTLKDSEMWLYRPKPWQCNNRAAITAEHKTKSQN